MKICPICALEFSEDAEFCAKCKVVLIKKPEKAASVPTDYKRLLKMILFTFLFIGFIALLYFVLGKMLLS